MLLLDEILEEFFSFTVILEIILVIWLWDLKFESTLANMSDRGAIFSVGVAEFCPISLPTKSHNNNNIILPPRYWKSPGSGRNQDHSHKKRIIFNRVGEIYTLVLIYQTSNGCVFLVFQDFKYKIGARVFQTGGRLFGVKQAVQTGGRVYETGGRQL